MLDNTSTDKNMLYDQKMIIKEKDLILKHILFQLGGDF